MTSTTPVITLINGPNLNLLGQRQPDVYGYETLADVERQCSSLAFDLGLTVDCLQSNHEGVIVDAIQAARGVSAGIIINPGAYSHTSIAIMDAWMDSTVEHINQSGQFIGKAGLVWNLCAYQKPLPA